jgi:coenzyme F420-reducing hydrogenase beta subunit
MIESGKDCFGCGVCAAVCPKRIIEIKCNVDGFLMPKVIDEDKCIDCSLCDKACSYEDTALAISRDVVAAYSYQANDEEAIRTSTSGGFANDFARMMLAKGYKICGCRYNYNTNVAEHTVIDNINDLEQLKGSKYIQSDSQKAFSEILDAKNRDDKYVVFGSPCQIDSLRRAISMRKQEDRFVLVDFFCHGVPTYNLWKAYLRYNAERNGIEKVEKLSFRDKMNGWHNFTFMLQNGDKKLYSALSQKDLFHSFFLNNICLGVACYERCKFKATNSSADIRMGDLWGSKYIGNETGVSGLLVFLQKANGLVKQMQNIGNLRSEAIDDVTESQFKNRLQMPAIRGRVINDLRGDIPLDKLYSRYIIPINRKRFVHRVINGLKRRIFNR